MTREPSDCPSVPGYLIQVDVTHPDDVLEALTETTPAALKTACDELVRCVAFLYEPSTRQGFLKSAINPLEAEIGKCLYVQAIEVNELPYSGSADSSSALWDGLLGFPYHISLNREATVRIEVNVSLPLSFMIN